MFRPLDYKWCTSGMHIYTGEFVALKENEFYVKSCVCACVLASVCVDTCKCACMCVHMRACVRNRGVRLCKKVVSRLLPIIVH